MAHQPNAPGMPVVLQRLSRLPRRLLGLVAVGSEDGRAERLHQPHTVKRLKDKLIPTTLGDEAQRKSARRPTPGRRTVESSSSASITVSPGSTG